MSDPNHAPWFHTTPEAVLRAESILNAFNEGRTAHIGEILAADYSDEPPPGGAVAVVVALIAIADRLADYGANLEEPTYPELIRDAARIVAQAHYETNGTSR